MAEFAEGCNSKEFETCGGVSQLKKKFVGVSQHNNRWRARVRDPKLKTDVYLGCYGTPEEAAIVVEKKRAEIQETYKGADFRSKFKGEKLPYGVRWENGRYRVRISHPKLKKYNPSFGSYETCEEAAAVAEMKRAELRDLQEPKRQTVGVVADKKRAKLWDSEQPETEAALESECLREQTGSVKVPRGVKRIQSGKWVARISDPVAKTRIWLGTYNTVDEAVRAYYKKKDLLDADMSRALFAGSKSDETSVKLEHELEYNSPASSSGADCLNYVASSDELKFRELDNHGKLRHGLVYSSSTSVDNSISESATASDNTCALDFDREVSLSVVNEYGQLLGEFGELDEQMWLNLPD